jgi:integrase
MAQQGRAAGLPVTAAQVASQVTLLGEGLTDETIRLIRTTAQGWSANTRRAFLSDVRLWEDWCQRRGVAVAEATGQQVARYVRELAGIEPRSEAMMWMPETRSRATIQRYLASIGTAYTLARKPSPVADPQVRADKKLVRLKLGVRQNQAHGLRFKGEVAELDDPPVGISIANLLKACGYNWQGFRDAALLRTAYDIAARASELVAINIEDILFESSGAGTVLLASSKTDQAGEGSVRYLSPATCRAIRLWIELGKLGERGPLFRPVRTDFEGKPISIPGKTLHTGAVTQILKRVVRKAQKLELLNLTDGEVEAWLKKGRSHSIRVGKLQEHIAADHSLGSICQAYGIQDEKTVLRYAKQLIAKGGAAAKLATKLAQ